jgi:hypothetical protein
MRSVGQRWKEEQMSWHAGGTEIVNAIRELRPGDWDASEGEVVDRILVLRPAMRTRRCCGRDLELVVEAERGTLTWGLWRCSRCERAYSVGPELPPTWVGALARACIELYCDFCAEVEAAYQSEETS